MVDLKTYINKCVNVITNDGRVMVGMFQGFDVPINIILSNSHERVYNDSGVSVIQIGLQIVRGDSVAVIGLIDEELDSGIDYSNLRSNHLSPCH
jgi:U6 snRNA-associated Sm-like protein LSm8